MLALASMAVLCFVLPVGRPQTPWRWSCPLPFAPKLVGVLPLPGWEPGWLDGASAALATMLGAGVHAVALSVRMLLGTTDRH